MPPKTKKKAAADEAEPGTGIDHYEVPKSTIARVAKGSVPEGIKLSKEVPIALVRATTVFISYLAAISQDVAAERSHKTINAQHVLDAVQMLEWEDGKQVNKALAKELKAYKAKKIKKKKPAASVSATPAASEPVAVRPSAASLSSILDTQPSSFTVTPAKESAEAGQLIGDEEDAESFGEPEEDDIEEEEESEEEPEEEVVPDVEDRGLQDDDAHMAEPEHD